MKKYILLVVFCLSIGGCSFLAEQYDYQQACMSDPACLEQAKKDAEFGKMIAGMAYPAAGAPVGAAILAIALWIRGRKKNVKATHDKQ